MDMTKDAIDRIVELARQAAGTQSHREVNGQIYSPVSLHRVIQPDPLPEPLELRALRPLVAYVARAAQRDGAKDILAVHVEGPAQVSVIGPLRGYHQQRFVYAVASCPPRMERGTEFGLGKWLDLETMVIGLQALFTDGHDRAKVLAVLGNLRDESAATTSDDGVTQTVAVKAGIALAGTTPLPNPVRLAPYRTFPEVEQPASPFVLRLRRGTGGQGPTVGLWEADGGRWQAEAMAAIEGYLHTALPEGVEVLA